jgi:flagellar basal-body rod protein FlgG
MGLAEIAGVVLLRAQTRIDAAASNIANLTTPGYKARHVFANALIDGAAPDVFTPATDMTPGKLQATGNPLDLAIAGYGFFAVRSGDSILYTRDGQFRLDGDGRLVTARGEPVQSSAGDVVVKNNDISVLQDGTVMSGGEPVARLSIMEFSNARPPRAVGAGLYAGDGATEVGSPQIRQGMLETSNVSTADEMLSVMAALRSAETGQQLARTYDEMLGRAISAFGQ